jgi:hypothetical protein
MLFVGLFVCNVIDNVDGARYQRKNDQCQNRHFEVRKVKEVFREYKWRDKEGILYPLLGTKEFQAGYDSVRHSACSIRITLEYRRFFIEAKNLRERVARLAKRNVDPRAGKQPRHEIRPLLRCFPQLCQ